MEKVGSHLLMGFFALAIGLVLTPPAGAESALDAFKQGNGAYAQGQFDGASSSYEAALNAGLRHWTVYYNLGNAYFKANHFGKAILNYERAFRLQPSQRDVLYNLNLAASKAGDPLFPGGELPRLAWRLFYWPPLTLLALAVLAGAFCMAGFSWLFALRTWRPTPEQVTMVLTAFALLSLWFGARIRERDRSEGVVVAGTAEVRSGPNLSSPANFTVPEGRRVIVLEDQEAVQGWLEIGVPQEGLKGWVPISAVEKI